MTDRRSLAAALIRDGRPLIVLTAIALLFSGGFALFLSVVQQFLPHDLDYLGMTARELCTLGPFLRTSRTHRRSPASS